MTSLCPRRGEDHSVGRNGETQEETLHPGASKEQDLHQGNTGASAVGGLLTVMTNFALGAVGLMTIKWKAS